MQNNRIAITSIVALALTLSLGITVKNAADPQGIPPTCSFAAPTEGESQDPPLLA